MMRPAYVSFVLLAFFRLGCTDGVHDDQREESESFEQYSVSTSLEEKVNLLVSTVNQLQEQLLLLANEFNDFKTENKDTERVSLQVGLSAKRTPPRSISRRRSARDILMGPLNDARLVGEAVILECEGTDGCRITWAEYSSGYPNGSPISDGTDVLEGHPNSTRYEIIHDCPNCYDLLINETVLADGTKYRCTDIHAADAHAYAELIMIQNDPVCSTTVPSNGVVFDDLDYTTECTVEYKGNVAPIMTWTGPEPFQVQTSTSESTVWSKVSFTAYKYMSGEHFTCTTNFTSAGFGSEPDSATNAPTYEYIYQDSTLIVHPSYFGSVTYIRWGRTVCGSTANIIYKGYAAGNIYNIQGGSSTYVCLPENPQWGRLVAGNQSAYAEVAGIEYRIDSNGSPFSFENNGGESLVGHDAPCVVCHVTNRTALLMIPAAMECPDGWNREYQGYLASESDIYYRSEYVCVDEAPETIPGGATQTSSGGLWRTVETQCVPLVCPPYVDFNELACVVCTR